MNIVIELNGRLRGLAGVDALTLALPDGAAVADALAALEALHPALSERLEATACAIGDQLVSRSTGLADGSRLVLIPPVSGG